MILESVRVGFMQVNCYIVASQPGGGAIIIDAGDEKKKIEKALAKHKLTPEFIINTHGHIDHIGCEDAFGVPIYVHRQDAPLLKDPQRNLSSFFGPPFSITSNIKILEDKELIGSEDVQFEVIHVPGHTPGGISLLMKKPEQNILFTGDSLFYHSIGRTDFAGASHDLLVKSIKERLFGLSDDIIIYPGHGPSSTIGEEKKNNPFLN